MVIFTTVFCSTKEQLALIRNNGVVDSLLLSNEIPPKLTHNVSMAASLNNSVDCFQIRLKREVTSRLNSVVKINGIVTTFELSLEQRTKISEAGIAISSFK